jgi:hypothetical protein
MQCSDLKIDQCLHFIWKLAQILNITAVLRKKKYSCRPMLIGQKFESLFNYAPGTTNLSELCKLTLLAPAAFA